MENAFKKTQIMFANLKFKSNKIRSKSHVSGEGLRGLKPLAIACWLLFLGNSAFCRNKARHAIFGLKCIKNNFKPPAGFLSGLIKLLFAQSGFDKNHFRIISTIGKVLFSLQVYRRLITCAAVPKNYAHYGCNGCDHLHVNRNYSAIKENPINLQKFTII